MDGVRKMKKPALITLHSPDPDNTAFQVNPKKIRRLETRDPDDRETNWKSYGVNGKTRVVLPGGYVLQARETVEEIRALVEEA